ncbi:MAG: carbonic anhydrase [Ignavibacteriales bacterium]|nr:carbonic anhydrase [Ignavibacteriales bacterium]MBI3787552.1 carbonic anhydrase [Ignavibacteriales bacterium]
MEANLKALVAEEEKACKADFERLKAQIDALGGAKSVSKSSLQARQQIEHLQAKVNPSELLERLQAGNVRYVKGKPSSKDFVRERPELAKGQQPYAIVLTCSDSRVPPEFIFDESLGQLFIVRTAGNVVDSVVLGSIEYAAEHLHAGLLVVLGHEACGAVEATIAGGKVPPNIGSLVGRIQPGVNRIKAKHPEEKALLSNCVEENVRQQMEQAVAQSTVLSEMAERGELRIAGGVYSLATGTVEFLTPSGHPVTKQEESKSHPGTAIQADKR